MSLTRLYIEFFESEKSGGIMLICATVISIVLANSAWADGYTGFWQKDLGGHTLVHWINDGLMTVFFLLIGLELEREIYTGELSNLKKASLPAFAALGGMLFPAAIYLILNYGTETQRGAGIPMATDIAFAIGILSLLGNRVPASLKIFLTALAVIDDLGAIIVISVFYSEELKIIWLIGALTIFAALILLNRLKMHNLLIYITGGIIMWIMMSRSGIHSTISGVLLAFAIPFAGGGEKSPSFVLQHQLHRPVAFLILPLFAAANMAIPLSSGMSSGLGQPHSIGIIAGLFIGKPLGIFLFSMLAIISGLSQLPSGMLKKHIPGVGLLGGIGFTMSIFIALMAFPEESIVNTAKISILAGSILSGIAGMIWLIITLKTIKK
ncbi:MAG TPA: Na+/H+ antiporter NhaA [Bacteroidales bacterium]|nr:Na+/H+ antiporter NhaA [Bacteroidales bacterium]